MADKVMQRVGFIGLGKMGTPMARRIVAAGYPLTAYARNDKARAAAAEVGAAAASLADMVAASDVVIAAISDDKALDEISTALAAVMREGQILVETSTVSPAASARAAIALAAAGVAYLRAPVSGSTATAEAGQLTVLASGPKAAFDAATPVLATFSRKQFYVGDGEQARYLKLALNAMVGSISALLGEAMTLGLSGGVDPAVMLDVINNSAVASPLIGYKTKMVTSGDYTPAFSVAQMMKDFDIILSVGRAEHLPLPLAAHIRQQYEAAFAAGCAEEDFFVLSRQYAKLAGLK